MFRQSYVFVSVLGLSFGLLSVDAAIAFDFERKLLAPDGSFGDVFGSSVSLDNHRALVGSPFVTEGSNDIGSAYLFDTTTGDLLYKLTSPNAEVGDQFGVSISLSLSDNRILVGSPGNDVLGTNSGLAFLFDATTGDLIQDLKIDDSAAFDRFGDAVSLSDNRALVGRPGDDDNGNGSGSAFLFDATMGDFLQKLTAPDGAAGDQFGVSVSLSGNRALVGSIFDDDNGDGSGSAYLFDATMGDFLRKLTAPDGAASDRFGTSVSLDGNIALVGSPFDDDNASNSGSAYLFDVTTGNLLQKLTAPDSAADDRFGTSVSLDGNIALVGSIFDDDNGNESGSAYLFDVTTGNFLQKLTAPDGAASDQFGFSVSLSGNQALIGNPGDDDNGNGSGSAYVFTSQSVPEPSNIIALLLVGGMSWLTRVWVKKLNI
ncbi:MAG: FG-GAP repeat protein [Microcystaceae cyanobacterium]